MGCCIRHFEAANGLGCNWDCDGPVAGFEHEPGWRLVALLEVVGHTLELPMPDIRVDHTPAFQLVVDILEVAFGHDWEVQQVRELQ